MRQKTIAKARTNNSIKAKQQQQKKKTSSKNYILCVTVCIYMSFFFQFEGKYYVIVQVINIKTNLLNVHEN